MANYTFSTKPKDTKSNEEVEKLKTYCKKRYINFSAKVIEAIAKLNEEIENGKQ